MNAKELYEKIGRDFEIEKYRDDWSFVSISAAKLE
jgi:hypothetical protein